MFETFNLMIIGMIINFTIMAWSMTNEMFSVLIVNVALAVAALFKWLSDQRARTDAIEDRDRERKQRHLDREQDRLDREQLAAFTKEQLDVINSKGDERLKTLTKEVVATRQVNIHAIKAANNFNAKLEAVKEKLEASPMEVQLTNDAVKPVVVKTIPLAEQLSAEPENVLK